jgi:hypothetical protein
MSTHPRGSSALPRKDRHLPQQGGHLQLLQQSGIVGDLVETAATLATSSELVAHLRACELWPGPGLRHTGRSVARIRSVRLTTPHYDANTAFGRAAAKRIWNSAIHSSGTVPKKLTLLGAGSNGQLHCVPRVSTQSKLPARDRPIPSPHRVFWPTVGDLDADAPPVGIQRIGLISEGSPRQNENGRRVKRMLGTVADAP